MNRVRWLAALVLGACLFAFAPPEPVQAATSDSVDLHVSISGSKSILIVGTTYYDYGALDVASSSVTLSSFTIQNNSTVFVETYTITGANAVSDTSGTDWTLASSTDTDQYALAAQFSNNAPLDDNSAWQSDDLTTSAQTCSATLFGNGTEAESGSTVGINETRGLWFRIKTPSAVTDSGGHTITVTLSVF